MKTNAEKLLSISKNPDQLPCLNGIRFLSMMWVVQGHRYFISIVEPVINLFDVKDVSYRTITFIDIDSVCQWTSLKYAVFENKLLKSIYSS